jgi:hypothetical protein
MNMNMKKIIDILYDYGMTFKYECLNSSGENIRVEDFPLYISIQNGFIYFEYCGDMEKLEENELSFAKVYAEIEKIIVIETT